MMRMTLSSLFILSAACSPEPPSIPQSIKNIPVGAAALKADSGDNFKKFLELKSQNDALCLRVQKQRVECPVATTSLKPEGEQEVLGCVSGVEEGTKYESNFEMSISIPSGTKAMLTTKNGMWQTNAVGSGQKQKLTWGPRSKSNCDLLPARKKSLTRAPRIIELTDMYVRIVSDNCDDTRQFKADDIGSFSLSLNGTELFDKGQLANSSAGVQVELSKLLKFQQDPKCAVPEEELAALMSKAKSSASSKASAGSPPADLDAQLSRETNRNDIMMKQLRGAENIGCWGYSTIKKLQVKIEGSALPNANRGDSGGALQNAGNSKEYTFEFGNNLVHVVPDEAQTAVFRGGGGFVIGSFGEREIQELRHLKIKKGGVSYQNDSFCLPCPLGIGCWCGFHRYEKDIRSISKMSILANDQLVYEKSAISFTFAADARVWPPNNGLENIQNNPAFVQLMNRKDCPAE
ncbi:MAG: hypothetical protein EBR09_07815 [Proteobacteria bacterium]|nr:hypothetical protein [Pseudomonadota bacterium]